APPRAEGSTCLEPTVRIESAALAGEGDRRGSLLSAPPPDQRALAGTFGRYHIVKPLGQGSMGTVYLAHDTRLDRPVALKVPRLGVHSRRPREGPRRPGGQRARRG